MTRRKPALQLQAVAFALVASVLFVLALAANPHWHERLHHHDADAVHEVCVVDLFAAGAVDHTATAPLTFLFTATASLSPALAVADVPSSFLAGAILEHAPPAHA